MRHRAFSVLGAALAFAVASLCALAPVPVSHTARPTSNGAPGPVASIVPEHARAAVLGRSPLPARCRAGLVALTFDDGPSRTVTPGLVRSLLAHHVPATFFMVGSRIHTAPETARLVQRSGFTIGNHTWSHPQLTHLSDPAVRSQLRRTRREMREHGIVPGDLMRPPYGDISPRVRSDIRDLGLVPVLWTIDSRDWAGGSARQIAHQILGALRPHARNVVLQHDGVTNSPSSVAAMPIVVHAARKRGYCFTHLGPRGGPVPPRAPAPLPVAPPAAAARDAEPFTRLFGGTPSQR